MGKKKFYNFESFHIEGKQQTEITKIYLNKTKQLENRKFCIIYTQLALKQPSMWILNRNWIINIYLL